MILMDYFWELEFAGHHPEKHAVELVEKLGNGVVTTQICDTFKDANCNLDKAQQMLQIHRPLLKNIKRHNGWEDEGIATAARCSRLLWKDHNENINSTVPGVLPYNEFHLNSGHYVASIWYMVTETHIKMPDNDNIVADIGKLLWSGRWEIVRLVNKFPYGFSGRSKILKMCWDFQTIGCGELTPLIPKIRVWHQYPMAYLRSYCLAEFTNDDEIAAVPCHFDVIGTCGWMKLNEKPIASRVVDRKDGD